MSRHKGHCSRTAHKSEDIASKEPSTLRQDNDNMEDEEVFEDEQRPGPSNESQVDNQDDCGACNSPYSPVFRQNYQWIYCTQCGTPFHLECSTVQFKATDYDNINILALPNYFCCTCQARTSRRRQRNAWCVEIGVTYGTIFNCPPTCPS